MKRKASQFEEDYGRWTSRSPLSDTSVSSRDSLDQLSARPVPWPLNSAFTHINTSRTNSRTRKRLRDNRPDIDMIYQTTLAKLYDAQKAEKTAPIDSETSMSRFAPSLNTLHGETGHERAQRSLHSFFNIQAQPARISPAQVQYQHASDRPETCDSCGNHLGNEHTNSSAGGNAMEIDHYTGFSLAEEYECAACQRRVCDTCAVRGDQRICLECALSGTG